MNLSQPENLWCLDELVSVLSGRWLFSTPKNPKIQAVSFGTLNIQSESLVFTTDPVDWGVLTEDSRKYISELFKKGASVVVTNEVPTEDFPEGTPVLLVEGSTLMALEKLAHRGRERFKGAIVAVVGSAGKSSTVEMMKFAADTSCCMGSRLDSSGRYPTMLADLAHLNSSVDFGFFEVEIPHSEEQLKILAPNVLVITDIGMNHVGVLKKTEPTQALGKAFEHYAKVVSAVRESATVIMPDYDYEILIKRIKSIEKIKLVCFGSNSSSTVRLLEKDMGVDGSALCAQAFSNEQQNYRLGVTGAHMIRNSLALLATWRVLALDWRHAANRLQYFLPPAGRGLKQIVPWKERHITLIDETVNASLASIKATLESLTIMQPHGPGKIIFAFGFIENSANIADIFYQQVAILINASNVQSVFLFGEGIESLQAALRPEIFKFSSNDIDRLIMKMLRALKPGDVILAKGSRKARMERLVNKVRDFANMRAGIPLSVSPQSRSSQTLWTPAELTRITGGQWLGQEPKHLFIDGVSVDKVNASDRTLVILRNQKSWGNEFGDRTGEIVEFFIKGAAAIITDTEPTDALCEGLPILIVADTKPVPALLARASRARLKGKVIGVTGSVGKTTTCEMLAYALGQQGTSYKIAYNRNTTHQTFCNIAETPIDTDFAIYEIGGHYEAGTKSLVMRPHIAIITSIGHAHASFFEEDLSASVLKQTAESKKHLLDGLLAEGIAILPRESDYYDFLSGYFRLLGNSTILSFGEHPQASVRLLSYQTGLYGSRVRARIGNEIIEYSLSVPGRHNIMNSLAAIAAAYVSGADWKAVANSLGTYRGVGGRDRVRKLQWQDGYIDIIDGSFSASVESIEAIIALLAMETDNVNIRRKLMVIGDLDRGGKRARDYFARLAEKLNRLNNVRVFAVGKDASALEDFVDQHLSYIHADTAGDLINPLLKEIQKGDIVAVKGSHELNLWKTINAIQNFAARQNQFISHRNTETQHDVIHLTNGNDPFSMRDEDASCDAENAKPKLWSALELQSIMGGKWVGQVPVDLHVTGVNYYPDQVEPGDLAITTEPKTWRSPSYKNTNEIISALFDDKKAAVVVAGQLPANCRTDKPVLLVENTRESLDALGKAARDRMKGTVVTITGSAGKTTTKELTNFLLSKQGPTKGSRKNYNHGPGVPLMLAETPPNTSFGVYEFSVDLPNVTEKKANIIRPNVALITNIHSDHLQFYETLEKLTDQKCLLFKSLEPEGIVVLNRDSALFNRQLANAKAAEVKRIITFGVHQDADMKAAVCTLSAESSDVIVIFQKQEVSFHVNQPGMHIVMDCLGALAAVHAAGGDWVRAAGDIEKAPMLDRRNEQYEVKLSSGTITLIDDTFSANPASMQAGLAVLGLTKPCQGGRRIAVMSEIKELGDTSAELHTALAPHVMEAQVDVLFTIGRDLEGIWKAFPKTMQGEHSEYPEHIAKAVLNEMHAGDIIWVKGSRRSTANLEMILSAIKKAGKSFRRKRSYEIGEQEAGKYQERKRRPPIFMLNNLRNPSALEVLVVGDTAFGENYQTEYESKGEGNILKLRGYDAPLAKVRNMLMEADLVVANLETPVTNLKVSPIADKKTWVHWGDVKQTPHHLLANNISVVGLANNHMFDFGEAGFFQTLERLEEAGMTYFGGGTNIDEAGKAFIAQSQIGNKTFTFAMIAMYAGPSFEKDSIGVYASEKARGLNPVSLKHLSKEIKRVKNVYSNVFIVLFPHWGPNYKWRTNRQAELAKNMLEEGADLILGHGAHMMQEIEKHDKRWVVYSLGNFMFNSKGRYDKLNVPPYSLMAKLRVEPQSSVFKKTLRLYPIVTNNLSTHYQTRFVSETEFDTIISLLKNRIPESGQSFNDIRCNKEKSNEENRFYLELPL